MTASRTITNRFADFKLLEVSATTRHPERRGPYLVMQTGGAPRDPAARECTFALTRRGTWMHCFLFFLLPRPVRRQLAVFASVPEVVRFVESLTGDPVVESVDSLPGLLHDAGYQPVADDPTSEAMLAELRRIHPSPPPAS